MSPLLWVSMSSYQFGSSVFRVKYPSRISLALSWLNLAPLRNLSRNSVPEMGNMDEWSWLMTSSRLAIRALFKCMHAFPRTRNLSSLMLFILATCFLWIMTLNTVHSILFCYALLCCALTRALWFLYWLMYVHAILMYIACKATHSSNHSSNILVHAVVYIYIENSVVMTILPVHVIHSAVYRSAIQHIWHPHLLHPSTSSTSGTISLPVGHFRWGWQRIHSLNFWTELSRSAGFSFSSWMATCKLAPSREHSYWSSSWVLAIFHLWCGYSSIYVPPCRCFDWCEDSEPYAITLIEVMNAYAAKRWSYYSLITKIQHIHTPSLPCTHMHTHTHLNYVTRMLY